MSSLSIRTELESLLRAEGFAHTLPSRTVLDHAGMDRLPVGIADLDDQLGGGVPLGALTEVTGAPSSGRTGVIVSLLAQTTGRGDAAAYVDAAEAFDPASAAQRCVDLSRLLWVRCKGRIETALKAADAVVRGGGARVVVLDLADVPSSRLRRVPAAAYLRLRRAAEHEPTALVLLADHPVSGASAGVAVQFQRVGPVWSGTHPTFRLLRGLQHLPVRVVTRGAWGRRAG
jgi:hypothetical protein